MLDENNDNVIKLFKENCSSSKLVRRRNHYRVAMMTTYIDNCIHIVFVLFAADVTWRFYKFLREYMFYRTYYFKERCVWQMIKRCYSYDYSTLLLLIICLLLLLIRGFIVMTQNSKSHYGSNKPFSIMPPIYWFSFIPLYCLLCFVGFGNSTLDYAYFIRRHHGLDYAEGMASNYFHGYLKLTLPSYTDHPGIRERIDLYSDQQNVKFAINRLIILIPNTMYVKPKIESVLLERVTPLETVMKNRAGVLRPFRNDVYRFTIPIHGSYYYIALEGATPLVSFFDSLNFQLSATWQMKEMQREILFKFYQHLRKLLEWPETNNEVELVFYNSTTDDGQIQDVGQVLHEHILNYWKVHGRT